MPDKKKILIVDDSWVARQFFKRMISPNPAYQICEAANGKEALEKILEAPPDCMVLDQLMPEMSGIELMEALNEKQIHFPVIFLSADIQKSTQERCKQLGAFAFLNKPPQEETLKATIEKALN